MQLLANINRDPTKKATPYTMDDFMPKPGRRRRTRQSKVDAGVNYFRSLVAAGLATEIPVEK